MRGATERMRILAVDPGEKRIGLAVSDPTGVVARALTTLQHVTRAEDASRIAAIARAEGAERILVGIALDAEGLVGPQARRAQRLAEAIRAETDLPVELWDESHTTLDAQAAMAASGRRPRRGARRDRIDAVAAAILLQGYLDAHPDQE